MTQKPFELTKSTGIIALVVIMCCFGIAKIPVLHTPYFWDEIGVYAPAALKMKDHNTISLLPGSLDPVFSRGHPLLSTAVYASAFKYLGDTVPVGHGLTIVLALIVLALTYFFAATLTDHTTAAMAALMLCVQPLFFANAGFVLPEVILAVFTVPCLWAIIYQRWGLFALFGSLAILTKESAIIFPATAFLFAAFNIRENKGLPWFRILKNILLALVPILVFATFLIIQKKQNGWYFFPLHVDLIKLDIVVIADTIRSVIRDLFFRQSRWFITLPIVAGIFLHKKILRSPLEKRMYLALWVFVTLGIVSAGINYYLLRYTVFLLPAIIILAAFSFTRIAALYSHKVATRIAIPVFTICFVVMGICKLYREDFNDTSDMAYLHVIQCEKDFLSWAQQQPWKDSVMRSNFPLQAAMEDERFGYVPNGALHVIGDWGIHTKYFAFYMLKGEKLPDFTHYRIIKTFKNTSSEISVLEFNYDAY